MTCLNIKGTAWNVNKQVFDPQTNTWNYRGDTSAFDHRHLRFTNGWIPADMDLAGALPWVEVTDQNRMTLEFIYMLQNLAGIR